MNEKPYATYYTIEHEFSDGSWRADDEYGAGHCVESYEEAIEGAENMSQSFLGEEGEGFRVVRVDRTVVRVIRRE